MENIVGKMSACLIVYNEAAIIEHCLQSLVGLADEIIVVHDGPCTDATLEIARRFTDHVFVRDRIGEAEPHRVFSYEQAQSDWVIQIDADEYVDPADHAAIRALTLHPDADAFNFQWELWNGTRAVHFAGLQKICLFKKSAVTYRAIPHAAVQTKPGRTATVPLVLHHRPTYNNLAWHSFWRKAKQWVPIHAAYFFPEKMSIAVFNTTLDDWTRSTTKIRENPCLNLVWQPLKMLLGQLKNGLWRSRYGWQVALQQYVYFVYLYGRVWSLIRRSKKI